MNAFGKLFSIFIFNSLSSLGECLLVTTGVVSLLIVQRRILKNIATVEKGRMDALKRAQLVKKLCLRKRNWFMFKISEAFNAALERMFCSKISQPSMREVKTTFCLIEMLIKPTHQTQGITIWIIWIFINMQPHKEAIKIALFKYEKPHQMIVHEINNLLSHNFY